MSLELITQDLHYIWPEVVMTVGIILALFSDLILKGGNQRVTGYISAFITGLVIYFLIQLWMDGTEHAPFGIMLVDHFSLFFKLIAAIGLLVVILFSIYYKEFDRDGIGEYYAILLSATLGGFFLVSSDHLLMLYLALEMLSLSSYVLAGFLKTSMRSSESALKYLIYGAVSSGIMVFGFSIFFGLAGDLRLSAVGAFIAANFATYKSAIIVATVMVIMGFAYKIAAFPFHFWCPDVYEGAPTPVTTFLAVGSKAAGFGLMLRFFYGAYAAETSFTMEWGPNLAILIGVLSAVTMTYGNVTAMKQDNAKRLLAYSSIAHAGYMLMGVAALLTGSAGKTTTEGVDAIMIYLLAYLIMNLGAFGFIIFISNRYGKEKLSEYTGLGWKSPYAAGFMVIFLLSLTGVPPTVGFIGKWKIFLAVIHEGIYWLAIVAAVNSVVSLFYYFRIAKVLFLKEVREEETAQALPGPCQCVTVSILAVLGVATIYFCIWWQPLNDWAAKACP